MDEMNNDKICEYNTIQNIYSAWSAQIGQNICDIIEKSPLLQVSVVRGGRQWSCSASSHNRVVGRSKNMEGPEGGGKDFAFIPAKNCSSDRQFWKSCEISRE